MTGKNWRFSTNSVIFSPPLIFPVMIKHAIIFPSKHQTTVSPQVQKVPKASDISTTTDISSHSLVEMSMQVHSLADPSIMDLLNLAETLKPIVKLEKYDPNRLKEKST